MVFLIYDFDWIVDFLSLNHHDIAEILLKVALNTITLTLKPLITVNKSRQTSNIIAASSQCMP
jgi:hypothetical protein